MNPLKQLDTLKLRLVHTTAKSVKSSISALFKSFTIESPYGEYIYAL